MDEQLLDIPAWALDEAMADLVGCGMSLDDIEYLFKVAPDLQPDVINNIVRPIGIGKTFGRWIDVPTVLEIMPPPPAQQLTRGDDVKRGFEYIVKIIIRKLNKKK